MVGHLDFRSHLKSTPFATQPLFDHSKSRLVRFKIPTVGQRLFTCYSRSCKTCRHRGLTLFFFQNYIARFGHGSAKLARQAQSKEKTLAKMVAGGLTEKVGGDRSSSFYFYSCGPIPPPVIMVQVELRCHSNITK